MLELPKDFAIFNVTTRPLHLPRPEKLEDLNNWLAICRTCANSAVQEAAPSRIRRKRLCKWLRNPRVKDVIAEKQRVCRIAEMKKSVYLNLDIRMKKAKAKKSAPSLRAPKTGKRRKLPLEAKSESVSATDESSIQEHKKQVDEVLGSFTTKSEVDFKKPEMLSVATKVGQGRKKRTPHLRHDAMNENSTYGIFTSILRERFQLERERLHMENMKRIDEQRERRKERRLQSRLDAKKMELMTTIILKAMEKNA